MTVVLTTQYLEEADQLADRIAVLDSGRVVADDTPAALKDRFARRRVDLALVDRAAFDAMSAVLGSRSVASDVANLTIGVATDGSAAHIRDLLDQLDPSRTAVRSFAVRTATLDDVFLALTGHAATVATEHKEPVSV